MAALVFFFFFISFFSNVCWSSTWTSSPSGSAIDLSTETWLATEITLASNSSYSNPYLDVQLNATFSLPTQEVLRQYNNDNNNNILSRDSSSTSSFLSRIVSCLARSKTSLRDFEEEKTEQEEGKKDGCWSDSLLFDPELDAVSMVMPGFWDGANVFRVRFAPPLEGTWSFVTSCSNPSDSGLHDLAGTVTASPYSGSLLAMKHGFLATSNNNRYFQYDDGTPFYWLGDTHWSGYQLAEHINDSDSGLYKTMFQGMVDARVAQGYTLWKAETFANNDEAGNFPVNEGGNAWGPGGFFVDMNVGFWQAIDNRLQYVFNAGLYVSMAQGIGRSMTDPSQTNDHLRLASYILARYGAFPVIWITCQEYDSPTSCAPCWAQVAQTIYSSDPYRRPNSLHNWANNVIAFHDQEWYSFVNLQLGHDMVVAVDHWLEQYEADPPKPILEDEANYENIIPQYGGGAEWKTRQCAWQAQIGGSAGYTYGGQGIWWGCYSTNETNGNCGSPPYSYAWYQTLNFTVGSFQMPLMKNFFTSLPWWTLSPNASSITWLNGAPTDTQRPFQKSNVDASIILAYLPNGTVLYNGVIGGLDVTVVYNATWFNPRNGSYVLISDALCHLSSWVIPYQPDYNDWVLLFQVTSLSSSGACSPSLPALSGLTNLGTLRNDGNNLIGFKFEVGSSSPSVSVTHLGRYYGEGGVGIHNLYLYQVFSNGSAFLLGFWGLDMSDGSLLVDSLNFKYVALETPLPLQPYAVYYIISEEFDGGDLWHDNMQTLVQMNRQVPLIWRASVYFDSANNQWVENEALDTAYGPLNFLTNVSQ